MPAPPARAAVLDMVRHLKPPFPKSPASAPKRASTPISSPSEEMMRRHQPRATGAACATRSPITSTGATATACANLPPQEVAQRITIPGVLGGDGRLRHGPRPARQTGARSGRGRRTAGRAHRRGSTAVLSYDRARSPPPTARVSAPIILRCTEGFTASITGHKREWLPLNSAQIATVPAAARGLGQDRLGGPRTDRRYEQRLLLLPAHPRRPHHRRRARRALSNYGSARWTERRTRCRNHPPPDRDPAPPFPRGREIPASTTPGAA